MRTVTKTEKITSVEELVKALHNADQFKGYLDIMKSVDIDQRELEKYYTWNDEHYTRNCIAKTEDFELLLICWEKEQSSPIHDFNSQNAWIHPVCGKIHEEKFLKKDNELERVSSVYLDANCFSYMNEKITIHRYSNAYEGRSVTMNLYAKPVTEWKVYDEDSGKEKSRNVGYDAVYNLK